MKRTPIFIFIHFVCCISAISQYRLYGTAAGGGAYHQGIIFYYDPITGKDSTVFSFNGNTQGNEPNCDLLLASNGLLYGMTYGGGASGIGVMYSFNVQTEQENILVNFNNANGSPGNGGNCLIQGKNGLLYGTTWAGGSHKSGVLFSYNILTNKDTVLFNFDTIVSGCEPCRGLYQDTSTGILYGTTERGGTHDGGVLYSFNPYTYKDSVLIYFSSDTSKTGPSNPLSSFIRAKDGLLYSMAPAGGDSNVGVIFTYDITSGMLNKVFMFNKLNGAFPWGNNLMQISNGMMYGMTNQGGSDFDGTIFSFDPVKDTEIVLETFNLSNGGVPNGSIIQDPDNNLLYGMTYEGGSFNRGVFFSYDINTSTYGKIFDFTGPNGAYPGSGLTLVKDTSITTVVNKINKNVTLSVYPNPSTGRFNFALKNVNGPVNLQIFNVTGESIYRTNLNSTNTEINLNGQPEGIYLYRVTKEDGGLVESGKLIIEK